MKSNQYTISAFQKLERLRRALINFAHTENAPIQYNNEEVNAYVCGYNYLREQIMNILNQNDS